MKTLIAVVAILILSANIAYSANPCSKLSQKRKYNISSTDTESCFQSGISLISRNNRKAKAKGIEIMSRFLWVRDNNYRKGAIFELANSGSPKAIDALKVKAKHSIRKYQKSDLPLIVSALITLNGKSAAIDLAKYSKAKGKLSLMRVIRNEYMVYTTGHDYDKMAQIAGTYSF